MTGAENYVRQLIRLQEKYDLDLEVVGVLQVLLKNNGNVDALIQERAPEIFCRENIFYTIILQMERIKRFDVKGITNDDMYDKKVLNLYDKLTDEFLDRLSKLNKVID